MKAKGVRGLAGVQKEIALLAVTWSLYQPAKRVQDRWSFRAIEQETGVSKSQLHRAAQVIRQQAQALGRRAGERLTVLFEDTDLMAREERQMQAG